MRGRCFMIRWADDFIIGCELESDARRIMAVLPKRFGRYGLSLHPEKTEIIRFKRPRPGVGGKDRHNGTVDCLGLTFYWARSYRGYWVIKRKIARRCLARVMGVLWRGCRENMHEPIRVQHQALCIKLRGWFHYQGVCNNYRALKAVLVCAGRAWCYWLSRRSNTGKVNCETFDRLCLRYPLARSRIIHNFKSLQGSKAIRHSGLPAWFSVRSNGLKPRSRMWETFTSSTVVGALGNRCFYPVMHSFSYKLVQFHIALFHIA